jgi:hypothetical protein
VNSKNLGPYGDAITYELMPYIGEQFRGLGDGWSGILESAPPGADTRKWRY